MYVCVARLPFPPSKSKQKDTTHFLLATSTFFSVESSPSRTSAKNVFQKTRQIILRASDSPQEFEKYLNKQHIFSTSFWCPCVINEVENTSILVSTKNPTQTKMFTKTNFFMKILFQYHTGK